MDEQRAEKLRYVRTRLKMGEYDGTDIMAAWLAIDELLRTVDALAQPSAQPQSTEPVAYEYRWVNPAGDTYSKISDWERVKPERNQSIEDRVRELRAYQFNGRPCYEVRPLYAHPQRSEPAQGWISVPVRPTQEMISAMYNEFCKDEKIPARRAWAAALAAAPKPDDTKGE